VNVLAVTITVGDHITRKLFGLTFNVDDLLSATVAGLIIVGLGLFLRARATAGVPGKMQLAFETVVTGIERQVQSSMGDAGRPIVPLAFTLFLYILIANWLELIPTGHDPQYLPAPTGDINFTLAMGIFVIILVHVTWIRHQGLGHYIGHYFKPKGLFLINIIEEIVKPITLALRLFGNIFSGGVMLLLIAAIPAPFVVLIPILDPLWKLIDGLFVGPVQAFIFSILTILYFEAAIAGSGH
jgi:F-type H+-transporting ATPase subunit a